jgi:hypothetical protein
MTLHRWATREWHYGFDDLFSFIWWIVLTTRPVHASSDGKGISN